MPQGSINANRDGRRSDWNGDNYVRNSNVRGDSNSSYFTELMGNSRSKRDVGGVSFTATEFCTFFEGVNSIRGVSIDLSSQLLTLLGDPIVATLQWHSLWTLWIR